LWHDTRLRESAGNLRRQVTKPAIIRANPAVTAFPIKAERLIVAGNPCRQMATKPKIKPPARLLNL